MNFTATMNNNYIKKFILSVCGCLLYFFLPAQTIQPSLYKVLTLQAEKQGSKDLPQDHGLSGAWQKLLKLKTTASAMHTQAHPDDEHADLLTYLNRGKGVRTSILCLNRGESGGNILGVESFDQLALLRTEEFLLASSYYGLDDLYFTNLVDYGYSKRVEEAYAKWGKQNILGEMVRVIRINRPLVIISRFHGSARDGHGNHQAVGELGLEAYHLAGDPNAFSEQITKEGLRPWKALKYYRGGIKADEQWNMVVNTGQYVPWIGDSYKNFSLLGYSLHRSQNGGHRSMVNGNFNQYYERMHSFVQATDKEKSFFDGIDTTVAGIFKLTGEIPKGDVTPLLANINKAVDSAIISFNPENIQGVISYLIKGLSATRAVIRLNNHAHDAVFMLQIKEQQFMDAIHTILGTTIHAIALPQGVKESKSFYEAQPTMGFVVPQQTFQVNVSLLNRSTLPIEFIKTRLISQGDWKLDFKETSKSILGNNEKIDQAFNVTVPKSAIFSKPYFSRKSIQENIYQYDDDQLSNIPKSNHALSALVNYSIGNEMIEVKTPVMVRQSNLPYGYNMYPMKIAPAIAVNVQPRMGIIPKNGQVKEMNVQIELINNQESITEGTLRFKLPDGWKSNPSKIPFTFTKAGEKMVTSIKLQPAAIKEENYTIQAIAVVKDQEYVMGYELSSHQDVDQTLLYREAITHVKGIDVKILPGLSVGYVMGVGDEVPAAIQQLGVNVTLLNSEDLATKKLDQFDAILVGTRAYAVRKDLHTYNMRLLDYAKKGGHLIVLFQTPEFVPDRMAPYAAKLPGNSEEVSEEDSPIKILDNSHRVLNYPNKISEKDFNNWVEQRGAKFFAQWDTAYQPIISTQDIGQQPQSGGWLMATYGKGYYTYIAYSFHRQLPYGVTGAYRLMANLLSYAKK